MVGPLDDAHPARETARNRPPHPWEGARELSGLAFATLWGTGPDPEKDGLFRLLALRRDPASGNWESFDRWADPFPARKGGDETERTATRRLAQEFGVTGVDLRGAPPAPIAFAELETFLAGRPVVVHSRDGFRNWSLALGGRVASTSHLVDLATLAALLAPGRLAAEGEALPGRLLRRATDVDAAEAPVGPEELRAALAILLGRVLSQPVASLAVLAHGLTELCEDYDDRAPEHAAELRLTARLLEHPSGWRGERDQLFPEHAALTDGQLSDALRTYETLEDALDAARPPWARAAESEVPSLPPFAEEPAPLDAADRRAVDEIFRTHLPRRLSRPGREAACREGQRAAAARIAQSFGAKELLLVNAPTGTGKTLAYLVPTLLWAHRNQVRVGVATFTRALQEQAMDRDVPIALACLEDVGLPRLRASVLKGRANYLCWRALLNQLPGADAPAAELLTWLVVALFGLGESDGDLDRLAARPPLTTLDDRRWRSDLERLRRLVRAETGCCSLAADRSTCAAEAARRRAERSHVVLTNHAFALARREFFRHVVFDECEHLHDVAHNAFSHTVPVRALRELLARLHGGGQGALDRVVAAALTAGEAYAAASESIRATKRAGWTLDRLSDLLVSFKDWRDARRSERQPADAYSLFREYAESEEASELLETHAALSKELGDLAAGLQRLAEHLDTLPRRDAARLRRPLELLRTELDERSAGVQAWIPRADGRRPAFRAQTFHDLETTARGDDVLAARVLLPHEFLGRHYYPDLAGAVFLSATTWLRGGFETSATYLGLARAANPSEEEEREPSAFATFRAPEAFDYGRVLVAVPRDAPAVNADKRAFLGYAARFVAYLAERTRGRLLVLFTNADDLLQVGRELEGFFRARHLPFWYQRMDGSSKEELGELFRSHTDSVLLGLDTFWYGTDFPGHTLEYVVLVRLPYGVPDHYHRAQCATLGDREQRRQIYLPRALAKFRQGFGRLMRRESDRGCVFVLDKRVLDPHHRAFLRELPVQTALEQDRSQERRAKLIAGETERCLDAAFAHMGMKPDIEKRGLARSFAGWTLTGASRTVVQPPPREDPRPTIEPEDVPF